MTKETTQLPHAIKIISVNNFKIIAYYNTGEYRIIDFNKLFNTWQDKELVNKLNDKIRFESVVLDDMFSWKKIPEKANIDGFIIDDYLTIGTDTLYYESELYIMNDVTILLRDTREHKGLTQLQLAKKIKKTPKYINDIENGKTPITINLLHKITSYLV